MSLDPRPIEARCDLHAAKMSGEGWHTTANVLWKAGQRIRELEQLLAAAQKSDSADAEERTE